MKGFGSLASVSVVIALGASLSGACTTHGDGGRCDHNNTTNGGPSLDCDNGLVCYPGVDITLPEGGMSQTDICCMQDRTQEPVGSICALSPPTPGSDASIPDGGFDVTVSDSPSDSTADQSSSDAPEDVVSTDASDAASD